MPKASDLHGIKFDAAGNLWITLEFLDAIARLESSGNIVAKYDVQLDCSTCKTKINTHPHGLGIGRDGKTSPESLRILLANLLVSIQLRIVYRDVAFQRLLLGYSSCQLQQI